jgi:penicillin-binding protein-related factor A (putative recombinase)
MSGEAAFNLDIGKALDWYYKISDLDASRGVPSAKKPFDGFGILKGKPVYWEAKFLKTCEAFNFSQLKQHQIDNLVTIKKNAPEAICLFIIGVKMAERDVRAFIFTDMLDIKQRKEERRSILKKEFEQLSNFIRKTKGKYNLSAYLKDLGD